MRKKGPKNQSPLPVIIAGLVIIAALVGILVWKEKGGTQVKKTVNLYGVALTSSLSTDQAKTVVGFLKQSVKDEFLPKTLVFQFSEKGNAVKGDSYISHWNTGGIFLSVLYGFDKENKGLAYLRIWTMPAAGKEAEKELVAMPQKVFNEEYLASVGSLACRKQAALTVCGKMAAGSDAGLVGVAVRSPMTIAPSVTPPAGTPPPTPVTIISTCWVAPAVSDFFGSPECV